MLLRVRSFKRMRKVRGSLTSTCEIVLETLTSDRPSDEVAESRVPLIDVGSPEPAVVNCASKVLRALEEDMLLPDPERNAAARTLESPLAAAVRALAGRAWELGDESLRSVWGRSWSDEEPEGSKLPRRAKRRIRRALRALESDALSTLEPETWREHVLAQAAASVVQDAQLSLRAALLQLLAHWPTTSHLGLESGGNLGAAVQLCPPARVLLLRIRDATIAALS